MTDFLIYDLKVSVLIAVCYMFYRLLLERDTLHRLSRVVLLTSIALSLVLPLCIITLHQTVMVEVLPTDSSDLSQLGTSTGHEVAAGQASPIWGTLVGAILLAGIAIRLLFLAHSYWKLRQLLSVGEHQQLADGTQLRIVDAPVAPFSWWNTIVVSRQDYLSSASALLLIHERSHLRLHHSRDVVFVELITALQWFNPVVWLLSRDLRTIHEYEADEAVLSQGTDMVQYVSLLAQKATGIQACVLANGINTSNLKKRIIMMTKRKSKKWAWMKALYILPVTALSLTITARTVTDYRAATTPSNVPVEALDQNEDPVFDVCEEVPQFPGGVGKMMEFMMKNVKYPKVAEEYGVTGRILVQFIVEKDGNLTNIKTIKAEDDRGNEIVVTAVKPDMTDEQKKNVDGQNRGLQALKDEGVRVVKLMPKWEPGKQRGQNVRVRFTIPVIFRLQ